MQRLPDEHIGMFERAEVTDQVAQHAFGGGAASQVRFGIEQAGRGEAFFHQDVEQFEEQNPRGRKVVHAETHERGGGLLQRRFGIHQGFRQRIIQPVRTRASPVAVIEECSDHVPRAAQVALQLLLRRQGRRAFTCDIPHAPRQERKLSAAGCRHVQVLRMPARETQRVDEAPQEKVRGVQMLELRKGDHAQFEQGLQRARPLVLPHQRPRGAVAELQELDAVFDFGESAVPELRVPQRDAVFLLRFRRGLPREQVQRRFDRHGRRRVGHGVACGEQVLRE